MTANVHPVLLEGFRRVRDASGPRGEGVEIRFRGVVAVARAGRIEWTCGPAEGELSFLRSAAKFFQAIPSVADGIEQRFALDDRALALMCASHGGEPAHCAVARGMLTAGGLDEGALHCGPHLPMHAATTARMTARGEAAGRIHNNCSGKHAGMMLGALARGEDPRGYAEPDHPVQGRIRELLGRISGIGEESLAFGIDGCGVPTFYLDPAAAARAFSIVAAGAEPLTGRERSAAARLLEAVRRRPHMIGGEGRFCSAVVEATKGRALVKIGADGFYGGMIPERGLGFALHVDDGSWNASERVCAEVLVREGVLDEEGLKRLAPWIAPERLNCAGEVIGGFRFLGW